MNLAEIGRENILSVKEGVQHQASMMRFKNISILLSFEIGKTQSAKIAGSLYNGRLES